MIEQISTELAPQPIGPYSQGMIASGEFLFLSGQIALTVDGQMAGNTVAEQTRQIFANIENVLGAGGCGFPEIIKTTVFLKDMNDFAEMNSVYSEFLGKIAPARSTIEVSRLPKDALVEIEVIAVKQ